MASQQGKRKTSAVLVQSIVLASILLCPMAMAAPPMPNDVQMVEPAPSLPKEIADFWGKWEGSNMDMNFFLIVEKIDEEKASVYLWRSGFGPIPRGWERIEAKVTKEYGKYKLWCRLPGEFGYLIEWTLEGKHLRSSNLRGSVRYTRVP